MSTTWIKRGIAILGGGILLAISMGGCGEPVREDRTITHSRDGENVGFQHGGQGVFVAGKEGEGLEKIFQPDENVLATSTPLFSPVDRRLIFTTAQAAQEPQPEDADALPTVAPDEEAIDTEEAVVDTEDTEQLPDEQEPQPDAEAQTLLVAEPDPAGHIYFQEAISYTCYLRDALTDAQPAELKALFTARVNHVGYVAANVAVRWSPSGDAVLYVDQVADDGDQVTKEDVAAPKHALFKFDLASGKTQRVFPRASEAMVFDWSPDGRHLACVLADNDDPALDGIWIGRPGKDDWWHVADSASLAVGQLGSTLESLRASRPVWSHDGARFVFASSLPGETEETPGRHLLRMVTLYGRSVDTVAESNEPLADIHFSPDDGRLGLVQVGERSSLRFLREDGKLSESLSDAPVRRFAGWSASGEHLAYVVPKALPSDSLPTWAFLLTPDPLARDVVYLADGSGKDTGRVVFSDMRVTFPNWSPTDDRLTLWITFTPTHPSWFSRLLGWGLRPGDPAAVLDVATGEVHWMAVNAQEKLQIGHYHLAKHDYQTAWRWYEEARRESPAAEPQTPDLFLAELTAPRDATFFEYHCLMKLGREREAAAKLEQFRAHFVPAALGGEQSATPADDQTENEATEQDAQPPATPSPLLEQLAAPDSLLARLLEDLYAAEVFLSVDAASDAENYFRARLDEADSDAARLSASVSLAQLLLLDNRRAQYVELMTETIAPTLHELWEPPENLEALWSGSDRQSLLVQVGSLTLLPMFAPEFLAGLTPEQLEATTAQWEAFLEEVDDPVSRLAVDLFLRAAYERLGRDEDQQAAAQRVAENPARGVIFGGDTIDAIIERLRVVGTW